MLGAVTLQNKEMVEEGEGENEERGRQRLTALEGIEGRASVT